MVFVVGSYITCLGSENIKTQKSPEFSDAHEGLRAVMAELAGVPANDATGKTCRAQGFDPFLRKLNNSACAVENAG